MNTEKMTMNRRKATRNGKIATMNAKKTIMNIEKTTMNLKNYSDDFYFSSDTNGKFTLLKSQVKSRQINFQNTDDLQHL